MLEKFSVKNFRNFEKEITLDLKASNYDFNKEVINEKSNILKFAMIYGYNGCGKSNFTLALNEILNVVSDNTFKTLFYTNSSLENYQNIKQKGKDVEFIYQFNFDNNKIVYHFNKSDSTTFVYEKLTINGETTLLFDRRKSNKFTHNFKGAETLNTELSNNNLSAVKYISSNANIDEKDQINQVFIKFINYIEHFIILGSMNFESTSASSNFFINQILKRETWLKEYNELLESFEIYRKVIKIKTPDGDKAYYDFGNERYLSYEENASNGEKSLLNLFFWLEFCKMSTQPALLCIDEFDAFYHIDLSKYIIKSIKKLENIQVLLTSHNPNLISNEILRPDAYFVMQNNILKSLNNLTEKEIRFRNNIEKMFKTGAFTI